jgi:hypothetical protein
MEIKSLFRLLVIVGALAYAVYWFMPYSYGYLDSETGSLLSYGGYGAIYQGSEMLDRAIFGAWMISAFGMLLFRKVARTLFLVLIVVTTPVTVLHGVSVETAGGALMLDVANIADGMVLALAFFSPVKDEFY